MRIRPQPTVPLGPVTEEINADPGEDGALGRSCVEPRHRPSAFARSLSTVN